MTLISLDALASFAFGTQAAPRGSLFWNTGFACIACGTQAVSGFFDLPLGEGACKADEGYFIIWVRLKNATRPAKKNPLISLAALAGLDRKTAG